MAATFIVTIRVDRDNNTIDVETLPVYEVGSPPIAQEVMAFYTIRETVNEVLFRGVMNIDPVEIIKRAKAYTEDEMLKIFVANTPEAGIP